MTLNAIPVTFFLKKMTVTPRRAKRPSVMLEVELPLLSDEAAAAVADVPRCQTTCRVSGVT
jgi:hypothetical protein